MVAARRPTWSNVTSRRKRLTGCGGRDHLHPDWSGFLYLAVVLDAFSRRIVGSSMATSLAKQLVIDALNMALVTRRPRGVIHHSDQGSQAGTELVVATRRRRSRDDEAEAVFGSVSWSSA